MAAELTIDICVITYKRPEKLASLLASLNEINRDQDWKLKLIVVDNDMERSAEDTVKSNESNSLFKMLYLVEHERGISEARNKALANVTAQYLCFIDDDEVVSKDWLVNLVKTIHEYDADIVFGPVQRIINNNAPEWIKVNDIYKRIERPTGTPVEYGGTGNVLIKTSALGMPRELFDPGFSMTGGGDAEYFYRLYRKGRKLVWCDEALVTEDLPEGRATVKWFLLRRFRNGQAHFRIVIKEKGLGFKTRFLFRKTVYALIALLKLPVLRFANYNRFVFLLGEVSLAVGLITAAFPFSLYYKEYQ